MTKPKRKKKYPPAIDHRSLQGAKARDRQAAAMEVCRELPGLIVQARRGSWDPLEALRHWVRVEDLARYAIGEREERP